MMKDFGKVSVIMSSYNSAAFIAESVRSVMSQTYGNWELLVTDDCSSDNTCEIVEALAKEDHRIRLFRLEKNSGAGIARNNSISAATGRYLAFLDSDDRWMPHNLERKLEFMESKGISVVYSSYLTCSEDGRINGVVMCHNRETSFTTQCDGTRMGMLTFMLDMEKLGKMYLPEIRRRQDWCYRMEVMNVVRETYGLKEPLGIYRIVHNSLSSKKLRLVKYNIESYHIAFGWSYLRSSLFFAFVFMPSHILKLIRNKIINLLVE